MSNDQQYKTIDFEHYKKTGRILHKSFDDSKAERPGGSVEIESLIEAYQTVLELSTDEILLEVKNRIDSNVATSLHNNLPMPLLLDELSYRSSMIDHILIAAIEKYTIE